MKKLLFAALLSICMLLGACSAQSETTETPVVSDVATETPAATYTGNLSATTGKPTTKKYAPVAVMIENSKAARPQTGLQAADIVYEAHMEGKITRFLCIFNDNLPTVAGPVRSARTYWVKIQQEYGCIYVHFGGPGSGVASVFPMFKRITMPKRVDGMVMTNKTLNGEKVMWRSSARKAPHNAYANVALIQQYYDGNEPEKRGFLFNENAEHTGESATTVTLNFENDSKTIYKYDETKDAYLRYMGSTPFTDAATGDQVEVKNVIVQIVKEKLVDSQHLDITTEGSGDAVFFLGGKRIEGTWEKSTMQSRTIFKDKNGNEIELSPGNTWVHLLTSTSYVSND